jgi:hypothetical protein
VFSGAGAARSTHACGAFGQGSARMAQRFSDHAGSAARSRGRFECGARNAFIRTTPQSVRAGCILPTVVFGARRR